MLEIRQGGYSSKSLMYGSERSHEISKECVQIFPEELVQLEDKPFFPAYEDELLKLEQFLAEPKFNGLLSGNLSFEPFSLQRCFNIEGVSAIEFAPYSYIENSGDALASNLIEGEKPDHGLLDEKLEGDTDWTITLPDICEEYLLDVDYITKKESVDIVDINNHSTVSSGITPSAEKIESPTNFLMLEATSDQNSSLPDEMAIEDLQDSISSAFGRETAVTGSQWLKHHIPYGQQNLDGLDHGLTSNDCSATSMSNDCQGALILSSSSERCRTEVNSLDDVFKFKRKPRARNVKRGEHVSYDYLKNFSSEVCEISCGFTDLREKSMLVKEKRLCRPKPRNIKDSLDRSSCYRRERQMTSNLISEGKLLPEGHGKLQHFQKESGSTVFVFGKEPFIGGCIQVPFDLSVSQGCPKKTSLESDVEDSRLLHSDVDSDTDFHSSESEVGISEDDCIIRTKKQKGEGRRKRHVLWSLSEVLKLVEGVSKCGVGKWTEIKKLLFPSCAHRTSVDLKDKWRNLLRTSGKALHGKKRVGPIQKNASHAVPLHILMRVKELSVMHPYPKPHSNNKVSQTASSSPTVFQSPVMS